MMDDMRPSNPAQATRRRPARRVTIADVMILVAATGVGSLLVRAYWPGFMSQLRHLALRGGLHSRAMDLLFAGVLGPPSCLFIPWMAAMVAMGLRLPRPRL